MDPPLGYPETASASVTVHDRACLVICLKSLAGRSTGVKGMWNDESIVAHD